MKLKKMKKGFTIVELVIVIAVIGVLTAILVPTFINLTAKANKASDDSLVKNLNTALKMEEAEQGAKNPTMHDAVLDLENEGYKLSQLVTKSKKDLLWNMETNQFELEEGQTGPNYWKICHNLPTDSKGFSVYAADDWSGAKEITVHSGFDAGYRSDFTSISYTRESTDPAQEVVIRTNGTASVLTVNAPKDIVHHYDYLEELTVTAVDSSSYHEHGIVRSKATIAQGHFVIESNASVNNIVVPSTATANSVSIAVSTSGTVQSVIDYSGGAIKEDETVIPESASKVVVEAGKVAYVKSTNTNYDTFAAALAATGNNDLVLLLADAAVDGDSANKYDVLINKSIKIDGNGFKMTSSRATGSATGNNVSRVLQIENLNNSNTIDVSLENIEMHVNAKANVFVSPSSQHINLTLGNCDFSCPNYPINVRSSSQFINIDIKDGSYIKGYCALNFYGSLSSLKVSDSTLHGYNTAANTNGNSYAVIVLDGGEYWGDAAGENARANTIDIQRSAIVAEVKPGCAQEHWISFQYGSSQNAQVTVKDSKILDKIDGNDKTTAVYFDNANTGDSVTMILTSAQITAITNLGYTVTPNSDGTSTIRYLA